MRLKLWDCAQSRAIRFAITAKPVSCKQQKHKVFSLNSVSTQDH
ncbi:hypothetical protein CEV34_1088 [Brucella pseudogrignonensis]|uniref:Uncharacterized protein n=1 Tax=Brucella pseudogrignonensis TaxID=419475 RepID=A0A256GNP0_9HYPH|nr:hypothetical protein CEV34_1088 [Brucella pseudogrignonensis]